MAQLVAPLVSIHVVGLPDPYLSHWISFLMQIRGIIHIRMDKQYVIFGCIRVIIIVFVSTWWNFSQAI